MIRLFCITANEVYLSFWIVSAHVWRIILFKSSHFELIHGEKKDETFSSSAALGSVITTC